MIDFVSIEGLAARLWLSTQVDHKFPSMERGADDQLVAPPTEFDQHIDARIRQRQLRWLF
jgi:hypothetical protein